MNRKKSWRGLKAVFCCYKFRRLFCVCNTGETVHRSTHAGSVFPFDWAKKCICVIFTFKRVIAERKTVAPSNFQKKKKHPPTNARERFRWICLVLMCLLLVSAWGLPKAFPSKSSRYDWLPNNQECFSVWSQSVTVRFLVLMPALLTQILIPRLVVCSPRPLCFQKVFFSVWPWKLLGAISVAIDYEYWNKDFLFCQSLFDINSKAKLFLSGKSKINSWYFSLQNVELTTRSIVFYNAIFNGRHFSESLQGFNFGRLHAHCRTGLIMINSTLFISFVSRLVLLKCFALGSVFFSQEAGLLSSSGTISLHFDFFFMVTGRSLGPCHSVVQIIEACVAVCGFALMFDRELEKQFLGNLKCHCRWRARYNAGIMFMRKHIVWPRRFYFRLELFPESGQRSFTDQATKTFMRGARATLNFASSCLWCHLSLSLPRVGLHQFHSDCFVHNDRSLWIVAEDHQSEITYQSAQFSVCVVSTACKSVRKYKMEASGGWRVSQFWWGWMIRGPCFRETEILQKSGGISNKNVQTSNGDNVHTTSPISDAEHHDSARRREEEKRREA